MEMFARRIEAETPELHEEGVRMRFIGRRADPVPPALIDRMEWAEEMTARQHAGSRCSSPSITAGRAEIVDAARTFTGGAEEAFRAHLYAPDMHDPDLIIRTSGEQRSSNFLLWQGAYSELVFRDELWPDFSREAFEQSLERVHRRAAGASEADRCHRATPAARRRAARGSSASRASASRDRDREPPARARRGAAERAQSRASGGRELGAAAAGAGGDPAGGARDRVRRGRRARRSRCS